MNVEQRAAEIFEEHSQRVYRSTDRLFAILIVAQWIFAVGMAVLLSPYGWEGKTKVVHEHVFIAVGFGAILASLPLVLIRTQPGSALTRNVIAVAQMLWSALLIHLSGGRIETHFHVFGSLAFLAFYRDWKILMPASAVVAADHLIRQLLWPESVYGMVNPEWWRFLEHAFWVAFEDGILLIACHNGLRSLRDGAQRQAQLEALSESEQNKAVALEMLITEMKARA